MGRDRTIQQGRRYCLESSYEASTKRISDNNPNFEVHAVIHVDFLYALPRFLHWEGFLLCKKAGFRNQEYSLTYRSS